jgi:hypothetical protein
MMKKIQLLVTIAFFATLMGCINSDEYDAPDLSGQCVTIAKTKEVVAITSTATAVATEFTTDDIIEAYVTSSDEGGNFYKSISFVSTDGVTGFSMPLDNYNLFNEFEPGRKVSIKMLNRFYNLQHSSTVIGSLYNNGVGRISGVEYSNVVLRSCEKVDENTLVNNLTIAQAKNNQMLNKLIEFDIVQFTDASAGKKYYDPSVNSIGGATNHLITDVEGNTIIVRVSEYADFAGDVIPNGSGKIRGVLTKFNNDFQFMIRTINDVNLSNDRITPFFEETFTTNWSNWTKVSLVGNQAWSLSTTFGSPAPCALMSGFASGNNANEDWLISPAIDLTGSTNAGLTFQTASRFAGNQLQIYVSTDYAGSGNPNLATWTEVFGTLDTNTNSFVWTSSGLIDISSVAGNTIYIGYKYTSTTSASSTWEVDNVRVYKL